MLPIALVLDIKMGDRGLILGLRFLPVKLAASGLVNEIKSLIS